MISIRVTQSASRFYPTDPETLSEINEWGEAVRQSSDAVVGDTLVHLDGGRESCRLRECNLGNVVTDAMLAAHVTSQGDDGWSDVTMAILNGGAIRSSINQGNFAKPSIVVIKTYKYCHFIYIHFLLSSLF